MKPIFQIICIFLLFLTFGNNVVAQSSSFEDGEVQEYELVYQWGLIWAKAGKVTFSAHDVSIDGKSYWNFKAYGTSYKGWDWFYKVRSNYEAYASKDLESLSFTRKGREGSHQYDRTYHVKEDSIYYHSIEKKGTEIYKSLVRNREAKDVLTAIYFCREIDFSSFTPQDSIPFTLYLDAEYFPTYLRYIGNEKWKNPRNGKIIDCIVFRPKLIEGTVFKSGENMTVYVTNDEKKVPVYIETDLVIGKAKIFLLSD